MSKVVRKSGLETVSKVNKVEKPLTEKQLARRKKEQEKITAMINKYSRNKQ